MRKSSLKTRMAKLRICLDYLLRKVRVFFLLISRTEEYKECYKGKRVIGVPKVSSKTQENETVGVLCPGKEALKTKKKMRILNPYELPHAGSCPQEGLRNMSSSCFTKQKGFVNWFDTYKDYRVKKLRNQSVAFLIT